MNCKRAVATVVVGAVAICLTAVAPRSLHNISYAKLNPGQIADSLLGEFGASSAWGTSAAAAAQITDAKLKTALQKRLLVPNPNDLKLGPPSPGPMNGMSHRTVTISNPQGQNVELELFTGAAGEKGVLAQRYALFDMADPWEHVNTKVLHLDDRATLGPPSAPVTIIEFADFECPFCARAFSEIETLVSTTHKGKVRLIWKNYPLNVHPWAEQAAIAAECARLQNPDAFWTFARNFYHDQGDITPQNLREHIDSYATSSQLDGKALNACVLGDAAEARINQDKKDAEAAHINSTPTFLVNGIPVVGLPSSNVFDFVITAQLQDRNASR